jgi:dihydrofolate reductase
MPRLRVHNFSVSLDGYAAGPGQGPDTPLGVGGERLHTWVFQTRAGRQMIGEDGGDEGVDDAFIRAGDQGIGATVMGRNMFGPVRGPWGDSRWSGWWGGNPPYHHQVFVLTHHPRPPLRMDGGTTFTFVTDGLEAALARAFEAADGSDVRLGGGVGTVRDALRGGLVDDLHVALVPTLLYSGERLFDFEDGGPDGYECVEYVGSPSVAHVRLAKAG